MAKDGPKPLAPIAVMSLVILISNELVQHPVQGGLLGIDLSLLLTWGAFTYSVAFLLCWDQLQIPRFSFHWLSQEPDCLGSLGRWVIFPQTPDDCLVVIPFHSNRELRPTAS